MGSIRVPAHFCGVVGLKPTTGRVSCEGHTPPATGALALGAVIGPMARRVEDLSLLLRVLTEPNFSEHLNALVMPALEETSALRGWRAAWYEFDGVSPVGQETLAAVRAAAQALGDAGLIVRDERPPGVEHAHALWSRLFSRAALDYLRLAYAGREALAGPDARFLLSASANDRVPAPDDFAAALDERNRWRKELLKWMEATPLIVAPVGAAFAFEHGARKVRIGEEQELSIFRAFSYSQAFNVYGLPSVSVPAGRTRRGLPVGVQIIGRPFAEESVLAAAAIVEDALGGWTAPMKG
jgi:amidase